MSNFDQFLIGFEKYIETEFTAHEEAAICLGNFLISLEYEVCIGIYLKLKEESIDLRDFIYQLLSSHSEVPQNFVRLDEEWGIRTSTLNPIDNVPYTISIGASIIPRSVEIMKSRLAKKHISIGVPKSYIEDIRKGYFNIDPSDLPNIHEWDIGLISSERGGGWIHLSFHCNQVDGYYYLQNYWAASFRQGNINKRTWKKIKLEEGEVFIRLVWKEDYEEEIMNLKLIQNFSVGSIGHHHMFWYIDSEDIY